MKTHFIAPITASFRKVYIGAMLLCSSNNEVTALQDNNDTSTQPTPWYMNIPKPETPSNSNSPLPQKQNIYFDPLSSMQNEKIDQADRLLNHTSKAILTRLTLEREHSQERAEETRNVRDHLVQFSDEPFGVNQARDGMRWNLEQNLMALSREDRAAQLGFWNDTWTMSRELLTCMDEHEKLNRRKKMVDIPHYQLPPRQP